ncbi:MAG: hypothetical protein M3509_04600, partial [Chloroflexota bacterium]|nr:hypothetical protein [Chloroflexota bacterium]
MLTLLVLAVIAASPQAGQAPPPVAPAVAGACTSLDNTSLDNTGLDHTGADTPALLKRLIECGYALTAQSDFRGAQPVFETAVGMARRRADPAALASALAGLGRTLKAVGDARAESVVLESLAIAERLEDRSKIADAASEMGKIRNMQARYEEAR